MNGWWIDYQLYISYIHRKIDMATVLWPILLIERCVVEDEWMKGKDLDAVLTRGWCRLCEMARTAQHHNHSEYTVLLTVTVNKAPPKIFKWNVFSDHFFFFWTPNFLLFNAWKKNGQPADKKLDKTRGLWPNYGCYSPIPITYHPHS